MIKNNCNFIRCFFAFILFLLCCIVYPLHSEAKQTIQTTKSIVLGTEDDLDDEWGDENKKYVDIPFSIKEASIMCMPIEVKAVDTGWGSFDGGFKIQLFNENGDYFQDDYVSLKKYNTEDTYKGFFYSDDFNIPAGNYTYRIVNTCDIELKVKYSIYSFKKVASKVKLSKSSKVKSCNWVKIGKISNKAEYPYIKSIKANKKGLIDGWELTFDGNIYVCGYKPGTGTVTVTLKNGKKFKTKLKVTEPDPNFYAQLIDYNTRDNYFTVKIKNVGMNNLTILSSGAYSMDVDYKSFDRKLYVSGGKSIVIKPGKSQKVKFKVSGKTTWHKYSDHTIRFYFTYYGKKYLCSVWDEDCSYQKGGKWYTTYWDSEKYENFKQ